MGAAKEAITGYPGRGMCTRGRDGLPRGRGAHGVAWVRGERDGGMAGEGGKSACTSPSLFESSADVASSRRQIVGSRTIARAIARRCFCPPESLTPRSPQ